MDKKAIEIRESERAILEYLLDAHILEGNYFGNKEKHYKMCKELLKKLQSAKGCTFDGDCLPIESRVCKGCPFSETQKPFDISKYVGVTRQELLKLPIAERREILKWQVNMHLSNMTDEDKLSELQKLDGGC